MPDAGNLGQAPGERPAVLGGDALGLVEDELPARIPRRALVLRLGTLREVLRQRVRLAEEHGDRRGEVALQRGARLVAGIEAGKAEGAARSSRART